MVRPGKLSQHNSIPNLFFSCTVTDSQMGYSFLLYQDRWGTSVWVHVTPPPPPKHIPLVLVRVMVEMLVCALNNFSRGLIKIMRVSMYYFLNITM